MYGQSVPDWRWEEQSWRDGYARVAGVDEAGRGPLAGPVVAAAVVLCRGIDLPDLDDSKRLSPTQRERLLDLLRDSGAAIGVGWADPEEIDAVNILVATHRAMARALLDLPDGCDFALVDGLPASHLPVPHRAIVKGDQRSLSISAASIVAKVLRDQHMQALDVRYPGYGLAIHKGYPTPFHLKELQRLGPSPVHRRSFGPVAALLPFESVPVQITGDADQTDEGSGTQQAEE